MADPLSTNIWHQGWFLVDRIGQLGGNARIWTNYTNALMRSHIRIAGRDDELVWDLYPSRVSPLKRLHPTKSREFKL